MSEDHNDSETNQAAQAVRIATGTTIDAANDVIKDTLDAARNIGNRAKNAAQELMNNEDKKQQ